MPKSHQTISLIEARRISLRAQGLADVAAPFGAGKEAVLRAIEHLGYIQIDTISVVERAHHHVLWSRLPDYHPGMLHDLHEKDRTVFEYWNHAASYLPMRDFRFSLPLMRHYRRESHWSGETAEMKSARRRLLSLIRRNGPLLLRDVESKKLIESWWNAPPSKIERRALHELWMGGRVMVRSRQGFQKVFDLPERIVSEEVDQTMPTAAQAADFHIRRALRALGIARVSELHYLHSAERAGEVKKALHRLVGSGEVRELRVAEWPDVSCYAFADALNNTKPLQQRCLRILSPFDNLVIQRPRLRWLFDFDYMIECYVPAAKRRFGYFVLPILWGEQFIGRMDAKADRAQRKLLIHDLIFEERFTAFEDLRQEWSTAIDAFMRFQNCDTWAISRTKPLKAKKSLI